MTLDVSPETPIDLRRIASEIARVGFKPGEMTIRATGTIEGDSFRPRGAAAAVPLAEPVHPAPDTMIEVEARVDYDADPPRWTIKRFS